MGLLTCLKHSLMLPRKESMFRLNRMNMTKTIFYILALFMFLILPSGEDQYYINTDNR
ncbi:membrane protein insertase Oxa1/YidC/SpoIIIJ [Peribacillus cavernae]|nr:membrane protein insertase Oxa1/YidC/SpoIIIJ [Peribacillus cavernae]